MMGRTNPSDARRVTGCADLSRARSNDRSPLARCRFVLFGHGLRFANSPRCVQVRLRNQIYRRRVTFMRNADARVLILLRP